MSIFGDYELKLGLTEENKSTKKDLPREPGDPAKQFKMGQDIAGLGVNFKVWSSSQGEEKFKIGLFGGESVDAKPRFVLTPSETLYDSSVNAQLCIGPYKPRGELSTRMARGEKGIATIDLVAGRMGSYARSYENDEDLEGLKKQLRIAETKMTQAYNAVSRDDDGDGDGIADSIDFDRYMEQQAVYNALKTRVESYAKRGSNTPIYTVNNYKVDAARVVICQKGDVDMDFGIRPGRVGTSKSRSFVALKGDDVRIVAREAIKLVTGTDDENAQGGRLDVPRGIDLIGGNDDQDMQPILKGTNVLECLDDMNDNISALNGIVMDVLLQQMIFNTVLAFHIHIDPFTGVTGPSVETMASWALMIPQQIGVTFTSILSNKINTGRTYFKYLMPKPFLNDKFICSKYNHTN
jgi:hypothetical protein